MLYDQNKNKTNIWICFFFNLWSSKLIKTDKNGNWQVPIYQNLEEINFVLGIINYYLQKHNTSLSKYQKSVNVLFSVCAFWSIRKQQNQELELCGLLKLKENIILLKTTKFAFAIELYQTKVEIDFSTSN